MRAENPSRPSGGDLRRALRESIEASIVSVEGLREHKKRVMRQLISDTATRLFLERGFDDVRVTEVARACGVAEKTVYNYFPTKESLLFDREEGWATSIRVALGPGGTMESPVVAMVNVLGGELDQLAAAFYESGQKDMVEFQRFHNLIEETPALWAAQVELMGRLSQVAALALADRVGVDPADPEPQIMADALMGLWRVHFRAVLKYSQTSRTPIEVCELVRRDVQRAARLIDTGLSSFTEAARGPVGRSRSPGATRASIEGRQQVLATMKQAKVAWRQLKRDARDGGSGRAAAKQSAQRVVKDAHREIQHQTKAAFKAAQESRRNPRPDRN